MLVERPRGEVDLQLQQALEQVTNISKAMEDIRLHYRNQVSQ